MEARKNPYAAKLKKSVTMKLSEETETLELSPNITVELNADGDLIGVEILKASAFCGILFWKAPRQS